MNNQDRERMAKIVGDLCGSLACVSVGFMVLVIMLSFTLTYYNVDAWAVVSVMIGIVLACILGRATMFLSRVDDCTPNDMFAPLIKYIGICCVIGLMSWAVLHPLYDRDYPNRMCYEVVFDLDDNATEYMKQQCPEYRQNVQQLLTGVIVLFPLAMILMVIAHGWFVFSRWGKR